MAEGMKSTASDWIAEIPTSWEIRALRGLASFGKGLAITKEDLTEDGVRVISYGQIHSKLNLGVHTAEELYRRVSKAAASLSPNSKLEFGDLVFADTSENEEGLGNAAYIDCGEEAWAGYDAIICRIVSDRLTSKYFAYLVSSDCWRQQLRARAMGVKVFHVTQSQLKRTSVLVPPIDEQLAITRLLDEKTKLMNACIKTLEEQIGLLERYRKSLIHEAVTKGLDRSVPMRPSGIDWIGDMPEGWHLIPLKYLATITGGFAFDSDDFKTYGAYRLLRGINVAVGKTRWDDTVYLDQARKDILKNYQLHAGDLVFGLDRPWIGEGLRSALIRPNDGTCYLVQRVAKITAGNRTTNNYLLYALDLESVRSALECQTTGVSVPHISTFQLGSIPIALPSLTEQDNILTYIQQKTARIDTLLTAKREQIDILKKRRQSLIYEYVTGKRRVGEET